MNRRNAVTGVTIQIHAVDAIVHHGVLEKGTNFIQKPFTFEGLAKKVREVLDR